MKILMTTDTYLPRIGGGQYHVHYLARALRGLGHDVALCTFERDASPDDPDGFVTHIAYRGISSMPRAFFALWRLARGADIIHAHYSYRLAFLVSLVALLKRIPFVVTQHGLGLIPQVGAPWYYDWVFYFWRWWVMKIARAVISTSEDMSVEIRACGFGKKIIAIPNGFDADHFRPLQRPAGEPVLLTVRRLVAKTGIQYLVQALPFLRGKFPSLRFVCIGGGRLEERIRALARDLGVAECIEFVGPVGHQELLQHFAKAHVVVFPSTAESTSLSCIEAMAVQRPVVASRVGGLIELLGEHGERGTLLELTDGEHSDYDAPFTLPEERIRRLADAIGSVLMHYDDAWRKAEEAAAYVRERYNWTHIAKRTAAEAYKNACVH